MRRVSLSKRAGDALALLLSLAVSLCVLELALRHHFHGSLRTPDYSVGFLEPDPALGWRLRPGAVLRHQELDFDVPVVINRNGLREAERAIERVPGRFRILLVSDSATFASGVAIEQSVPALLAARLGHETEVVNFAVPAYSTVQELLFYRAEGVAYRPDLVLLAMSPINDLQTNVEALQARYQKTLRRPYAKLEGEQLRIDFEHAGVFATDRDAPREGIRGWLANQVVLRLYKHVRRKLLPGRPQDPNVFFGWPFLASFAPQYGVGGLGVADYEALWDDAWRTTQALILALRDEAESGGARFALFASPAKIQGDPRYRARVLATYPELPLDVHRFSRELAAFGEQHGIPVLDALPAIEAEAAAAGGALYFDLEDEHLTARGQAVVADALARELARAGLVPPAN